MTEEAGKTAGKIIVYGAAWCPDVLMTRAFLDRHGIPHEYLDIDNDEGAKDALLALRGKAWVVPTLVLPDGAILDNPSRRQLSDILDVHGFKAAP